MLPWPPPASRHSLASACAQLSAVAVELFGMGITPCHHRGALGDAQVRLPQPHPVLARQPGQPLARGVQKLRIGREGDVLGLHGGVDVCDPDQRNRDVVRAPPPIYDKPFEGTLIENIARDMFDMERWCAPHPRAGSLIGCAFTHENPISGEYRCFIFIAPDFYLKRWNTTAEAARRHEIAHCNGWPNYHPR
jgi:hypothetical protein